jgi:acetyl esterase
VQVGLNRLVQAELERHVAECRAFYVARGERRGPASVEELREARAEHVPASLPDGVDVELAVDASGQKIPLRIFMPKSTTVQGVYFDIPGGGFYLGSTAGGDARNLALAESLGIAVVSVDYRLAPENPWPAAPDDCEAAALWIIDQAEVRFGTTNLVIGGSSAGATLAMTTLLRLRDNGHADSFAGAALQFGTYDLSGQTAAGRLIADEYFLTAYVGHVADRTAPDISPIFGDLRDLPPTLLIVGALDVLLEDNLVMAARLSAAGGEVDLRIYPEAPHGFSGHPTGMARAALNDRDSWLAERITTRATSR